MGKNYKIIATDFDGTLCDSSFPTIGRPHGFLIAQLITARQRGHKVILWTCREGESLAEAIWWSREQGLEFDAVNENLPEEIERFGTNPRKIGADIFLDDKSMNQMDLNDRILFPTGEWDEKDIGYTKFA